MNEAILNIETYSTEHNAALAQISMVYFDRNTNQILKSFLANIDPESELKNGYHVNPYTLEWWDSQPDVIKEKLNVSQISITDALNKLVEFIEEDTILWCNKQFDISVITNAFKIERIYCPIKYSNYKDIETLTYLANIEPYKKVHEANTDLANQIGRIISSIKIIKEPI